MWKILLLTLGLLNNVDVLNGQVTGDEILQRLTDLEGRVEAIKKYLMKEKKSDMILRVQANNVIEDMRFRVTETDGVILKLKDDVKDTLKEFDNKVVDVNKTAHVKVNANGAVLYGGIGSSCSTNGGECVTPHSECRGYKCQCEVGLSYDLGTTSCVSECQTYGLTYQSVQKRIIRGHNDKTLEGVKLEECIDTCNTEASFECRSFDYFPQWRSCFLSAKVQADVPEAWEYNMEGYHFQRDCL